MVSVGDPTSPPPFQTTKLRSSGATSTDVFEYTLPIAILNLPFRRALHRDPDGTVWCLAVTSEWELVLFRIDPQGAIVERPIAQRLAEDVGTKLVAHGNGVVVVTSIGRDDAAAIERLGLDPWSHDESALAIANFDRDGNLRDAASLPSDTRVEPGAAVASGSTLVVTGIETTAPDQDTAIVSTWNISPDGALALAAARAIVIGPNRHVINAVHLHGADHIVLTGEQGFEQASTGSVVTGSEAFVAVLDDALELPPIVTSFGDAARRNAGSVLYHWQNQLWLLAQLDAPKTHDADSDPARAYSRAEIYTVVVPD